MPKKKRNYTKYPGVYYIEGSLHSFGQPEKIYYIRYRKNRKSIEEKIGGQYQDDLTPARVSNIRTQRIEGKESSNHTSKILTKWTIHNLWEKYVIEKSSNKGIHHDINRYKKHLLPNYGDRLPSDITFDEIESYKIELLITKKPQTVTNILELLKRIINFGKKRQLCASVNFEIIMPKVNNIKTEDLNEEQLAKLLKTLDEYPDIQVSNLMKFALCTGMRRGELFKLKWSDVNFNREYIIIRDPKGGKDEKIPLNKTAKILLLNHPKTNIQFIFTDKDNQKLSDISKHTKIIKKLAELPNDFRPLHGLRHVFASTLASSGKVDMYILQKLLTHKSPIMTQRYAHLRDDALKEASSVIEGIFSINKK